MRFDLLARRIMAPALGLALAATVAACSSSSSSGGGGSTSAPPSSPAPSPSSSAPSSPASSGSTGSTGNAAASAAITKNWEAFFNGKTSASKKIALLQNGDKFAMVIRAQAGTGIASGATAKVKAVVVNSPTSATVSYDILLNGTPTLQNQTGTAVYENGTWKVGDVSFCQLLTLENNGKPPSVCSAA